jgi:hypothetical protein
VSFVHSVACKPFVLSIIKMTVVMLSVVAPFGKISAWGDTIFSIMTKTLNLGSNYSKVLTISSAYWDVSGASFFRQVAVRVPDIFFTLI